MKKTIYLFAGAAVLLLFAVLYALRSGAFNAAPAPLPAAPTLTPAPTAALPAAATPQPGAENSPAPLETAQPAATAIPAHTVNGFTAAIESSYVDISHVILQVRISGGDSSFGNEYFYSQIASTDLYGENGSLINTSGGWGPAVDPTLIQFELVPVTLLTGERLKGQFAFDITGAPDYNQVLAHFRFDLDLPIQPEKRYAPQQTVRANGVDMLLDSLTISPAYTQFYLCFLPPSYAPWTIGSQSTLQIGERRAALYTANTLFNADAGGDRRAGSEPYWAPPVKNGSCVKIGFQTGVSTPAVLTLTIPELEKMQPDVLLSNQLLLEYPALSPRDAYHAYLQEHDSTLKGPWVFTIDLTP